VWNAAGGTPEEVAASSAILDRHCADVGRDPREVRRSVQLRADGAGEDLLPTVEGYAKVGVTDLILIVAGADPVAAGEQVAQLLPRLRSVG
jgi:hypothetical protein